MLFLSEKLYKLNLALFIIILNNYIKRGNENEAGRNC